jgi:hypothetical protein
VWGSSKLLQSLRAALMATHTFPGGSTFIQARVPIVTGTLVGGLQIDISAREPGDQTADNGVALMQACLDAQPHARSLLLTLKALLKQRQFNKVRAAATPCILRPACRFTAHVMCCSVHQRTRGCVTVFSHATLAQCGAHASLLQCALCLSHVTISVAPFST